MLTERHFRNDTTINLYEDQHRLHYLAEDLNVLFMGWDVVCVELDRQREFCSRTTTLITRPFTIEFNGSAPYLDVPIRAVRPLESAPVFFEFGCYTAAVKIARGYAGITVPYLDQDCEVLRWANYVLVNPSASGSL